MIIIIIIIIIIVISYHKYPFPWYFSLTSGAPHHSPYPPPTAVFVEILLDAFLSLFPYIILGL
jgi:hypothetical protein